MSLTKMVIALSLSISVNIALVDFSIESKKDTHSFVFKLE